MPTMSTMYRGGAGQHGTVIAVNLHTPGMVHRECGAETIDRGWSAWVTRFHCMNPLSIVVQALLQENLGIEREALYSIMLIQVTVSQLIVCA